MEREELEKIVGILTHTLEYLNQGQKDTGMLYFDIQKFFYYLKEELDDDNHISNLLPYYWYFDGPVSDVVQEAVNLGDTTGQIYSVSTPDGGNMYKLITDEDISSQYDTSNDFSTALDASEMVVDEYNIFRGYEDKLEDVYEDADYDFQRYCKYELLPAINQFEDNLPFGITPEETNEVVSVAEATVPFDGNFETFNQLFSRYTSLVELYLSNVDAERRKGASTLNDLTQKMWELFCYRLRLVVHDPYYEVKIDDWKNGYEHKVYSFVNDLNQFQQFVDEEYLQDTSPPLERLPEESAWGTIVSGQTPYKENGE